MLCNFNGFSIHGKCYTASHLLRREGYASVAIGVKCAGSSETPNYPQHEREHKCFDCLGLWAQSKSVERYRNYRGRHFICRDPSDDCQDAI